MTVVDIAAHAAAGLLLGFAIGVLVLALLDSRAFAALLASLHATAQYRRERCWLERDPYGYLRFALGLPPDTTEAEIDAVLLELGRIGRQAGVSAEEFVEGLRRVFTA